MDAKTASKKLRRFFRTNKRLPSYSEMCLLFGFASKKACFDLAKKLIREKYIAKDETGRLIPRNLFGPLLNFGPVKAGYADFYQSQLTQRLNSFDEFLVDQPETSYLLEVSGDSMTGAGIQPGDILVVDNARRAREGDIVVASIDDEWTLKYLRKNKNNLYLSPANPKYRPLYPRRQLKLGGVVVSVVRKYH